MILKQIIDKKSKGKKQLAVLIDPDNIQDGLVEHLVSESNNCGVDYLFLGGSQINGNIDQTASKIKSLSGIPLVLFPGSMLQISDKADGVLLLSLISGRNPDFLIGHHVVAAPVLASSGLEIIPTGYMLIEGGKLTSVEYMSNTRPIPADKNNIAVSTALAGQMLGLQAIYLESGSGADNTVKYEMVSQVRKAVSVPLIVGGGIRTSEQASKLYDCGADIIVISSICEKTPAIIKDFAKLITHH